MEKTYLTVKEVANLLGVTPLTIRNWDKKGKLVAYRNPINNYRVYKRTEIEKFVEKMHVPRAPADKSYPQIPPKPGFGGEKPKVKKLKVRFLD